MNNRSIHLNRVSLYSILILILLNPSVHAQKNNREKILLRKADRLYSYFKYTGAIKQYKRILIKDKNNELAIYGLGNCYLQLNDYQNALSNFNKLKDSWIDSSKFMYNYLQTLRANGQYELADQNYNNYLSRHSEDPAIKRLEPHLHQEKDLYKDSLHWNIGFLNINSKYRDYSPFLLDNSLVFISTRPSGREKTHNDKDYHINRRNSFNFSSIYEIKNTDNVIIQPVKPNQILRINTDEELHFMPISLFSKKGMNVGPVTFNKDRTQIYYTANNIFKDHTSWLGIMCANFINGTITESKPFAYNEKQYSVEHPALSPDGRFLYFTSDKPGGEGGFDLYSCKFNPIDKNWSAPQNLGNFVNTQGNEMFPYVDNEGNLYFSSDGLAGLGGLDLFYVKMRDGFPLGVPQNLGYPLNSSFDDFGITMASTNAFGYFSSNRREENDDIYRFDTIKSNSPIYIKGTIFDDATRLRVRGVAISLKDSEGKTYNLISDSAGNFNIMLNKETIFNANSQKDGYLPLTQELDTKKLVPDHFISLFLKSGTSWDKSLTIPEDKNKRLPKVDLKQWTDSLNQTIENRYIVHYEFDSAVALDGEISVLDSVVSALKYHPEKYIIVASFTDCHGNLIYNEQLSRRRSAFVKKYLSNKGLPDKNINTEYFGKKHMVLPCKEDKNFDKQLQQLNRRTEIIITKNKNEKWKPYDSANNTLNRDLNRNEMKDPPAINKEIKRGKKLSKIYSPFASKDLQNKAESDINKKRNYTNNHTCDTPSLKETIWNKFVKKKIQKETLSRRIILEGSDLENAAFSKSNNEKSPNARLCTKYINIKTETLKDSTYDNLPIERRKQEEKVLNKINGRSNNDPIFVETVSDSVLIALYDNGVFDHDSVSVVYNNKVLADKQLLNVDKAMTFHLKIDEEQKNNKLVFFADNLGDISPNSCLMVVSDGAKRKEIPVTTDLKHNTIVIFLKKRVSKTLGFVSY